MNTPRITILGSKGFIGSHLAACLRRRGQDCDTPDRGDTTVFARDLGHVIYAIGLTSDFRTRPLDTVQAHVCVLRELLAAGNFSSLTYLSSTRVYAGAASTREDAQLAVNPNDPSDLYNLSKLMGESLCLHGGAAQAKVVRLSNIVGLRDTPDIFIDQLLAEGFRNGSITLRTSLESCKDYLYIDDAVSQILAIAQSQHTGIFNVASGVGVSNAQLTQAITRELGFPVSIQANSPTWTFDSIDTSKARSCFGFEVRTFDDYFPQFLNLYRQKKGS